MFSTRYFGHRQASGFFAICPSTPLAILFPLDDRISSEGSCATPKCLAYEGDWRGLADAGELVVGDAMAWLWRFLRSDEDRR